MDRIQYVVNLVAEEGAEVAQAAQKALRFGLLDMIPRKGITNLQNIYAEYMDLKAVMLLLEEELRDAGVPIPAIDEATAIKMKQDKVVSWGERSITNGTLTDAIQDKTVLDAIASSQIEQQEQEPSQ